VTLAGGCFCGHLRYEASGPVTDETNCHCTICRRTSGAPFVSWFSVSAANFRLTRGTPQRFRSSEGGERAFCPRCGTPITFQYDALPDEIDITTCSLDEPEQLPPQDHIQTSSQLSWLSRNHELPRFSGSRT
jgi:hypothetical protein